MALNKAKTSLGMKVLLIILIVAFLGSFMYGGFVGIVDAFRGTGTQSSTSTDPVTAVNNTNKARVDPLLAAQASDPTSYTVLVNLGNAYMDWGDGLGQLVNLKSGAQLTAQQQKYANEATDKYAKARAAYAQAVALKPGDSGVTVDYAISTYYSSGDTTSAIAIAEPVTVSDPTFVNAWLNLGVFYSQSAAPGAKAKAIAAYNEVLKLDPTGAKVDVAAVKQRLKDLGQ